MDALRELKDAVKNNLNIPGLVAELQKDLFIPGLKEAVAKTATPLDDMAVAALAPLLQSYIDEQTKAAWDKLLIQDAPKSEGQGDVL